MQDLNKIIQDHKLIEDIKKLKPEWDQMMKNNSEQAMQSFLGDLPLPVAIQMLKNQTNPVAKELHSILESFQLKEETQSLRNDSESVESLPSSKRLVACSSIYMFIVTL